MTPEQTSTITTIVDCCADIRRLYGAIVLKGNPADEHVATRMISLEDDLAEYRKTAVAQGLTKKEVTDIVEKVLPPERFKQIDDA